MVISACGLFILICLAFSHSGTSVPCVLLKVFHQKSLPDDLCTPNKPVSATTPRKPLFQNAVNFPTPSFVSSYSTHLAFADAQ